MNKDNPEQSVQIPEAVIKQLLKKAEEKYPLDGSKTLSAIDMGYMKQMGYFQCLKDQYLSERSTVESKGAGDTYKFRVLHRETKDLYWFDVRWGNRHGTGGGWLCVLPIEQQEVKHTLGQGDSRIAIDPDECDILPFALQPHDEQSTVEKELEALKQRYKDLQELKKEDMSAMAANHIKELESYKATATRLPGGGKMKVLTKLLIEFTIWYDRVVGQSETWRPSGFFNEEEIIPLLNQLFGATGEGKTAEEILLAHTQNFDISHMSGTYKAVLAAMEAYANQYRSQSPTATDRTEQKGDEWVKCSDRMPESNVWRVRFHEHGTHSINPLLFEDTQEANMMQFSDGSRFLKSNVEWLNESTSTNG